MAQTSLMERLKAGWRIGLAERDGFVLIGTALLACILVMIFLVATHRV